mgnify:CR=1 FL=1
MRRLVARLAAPVFMLLTALVAAPAGAHKPSDSYLRLAVDGARIDGQWDIALRDLEHAIGIDANGDGRLTWGEVRARHAEIAGYALAHLALALDGEPCTVRAGTQLVDDHSDGAYTVVPLAITCPHAGDELTVDYRLFGALDPQHRGLLRLTAAASVRSAVLDPARGPQRFEVAARGAGVTFAEFLGEGVHHIWIGADHVLFLLSLLLPAVLVWRPRGWAPVERLRDALVDVLKIVTAFTLAHSITLTLATLGVVQLPSALVESAIAASVVAAALNNVWPVFHGRRWLVAFAFGLIHGFGFASVLADLGLPQAALLLALVAFNIGVELGQLAIVGVFVPLAYAVRDTVVYRRGVLGAGSALVALVAATWFVERAFGIALPRF